MRKLKDTDYLYISTRLKVLEKTMLTRDKYLRLASAKTVSDSLKALEECGWTGVYDAGVDSLDDYISKRRSEILDLLYKYSPDRRVIDVFRLKYDYHNIKVYVKSQSLGISADELYSNDGTIPYKTLIGAFRDKKFSEIPEAFVKTESLAEDLLARSRDPQLSDLIIDKAHISDMRQVANEVGGPFLKGYVSLFTDLCNLRVALRSLITKKDRTFRQNAFLPCGNTDPAPLINDNSIEQIRALYNNTDCSHALEAGCAAASGDGDMSLFDKAFDATLISYINKAKLIPFGEAQVVSYLVNTENEHSSVKTVIVCKKLGLNADEIMERLRCNDV